MAVCASVNVVYLLGHVSVNSAVVKPFGLCQPHSQIGSKYYGVMNTGP